MDSVLETSTDALSLLVKQHCATVSMHPFVEKFAQENANHRQSPATVGHNLEITRACSQHLDDHEMLAAQTAF